MGTCVVCTVLFLITLFLSSKYDIDTALIMMGAQYNTFTLGLHQVYRLVLNGFLHGSIMHLVFNLMAFYYVGIGIERRLKTKKYLILLLSGIVFSSLSAGIISANTITIGLSGAIYCIFVYYITLPFFDLLAEKEILSPYITATFPLVAFMLAICGFYKSKDL